MAGRSENKMEAEDCFRLGGWSTDLHEQPDLAAAYQIWTGRAVTVVVGNGRLSTEAGRGNILADAARIRQGRVEFLSVKGCNPSPSKAVITTGAGVEIAKCIADLGMSIPTICVAQFDSGRVAARAFDLSDIIRTEGIAPLSDYPIGGYRKGQAPPLYECPTTRPSGVKRAQDWANADLIDADDVKSASLKTYTRLDLSFAALGWSRGRGWTEIPGLNGEIDQRAVRAFVAQALPWDRFYFAPQDRILG